MKKIIILFWLSLCLNFHLAEAQNKHLSHYDNLLGGMWVTDAEWEDGTPFKLEIEYYYGLSNQIIKTRTMGNISATAYEHGLRNEGIIAWNQEDELIQFWEFDIFGGITSGSSELSNGKILYHYSYKMGDQSYSLTDMWEYIDDNQYKYIVGEYDPENQSWKQIYLNTVMRRIYD
jgi:hypothetical protein